MNQRLYVYPVSQILLTNIAGDDGDEDGDDEQEDGEVMVEALGGAEMGERRVERIPPEPISADEAESESGDKRTLPEPVSCGEEDDNEEQ